MIFGPELKLELPVTEVNEYDCDCDGEVKLTPEAGVAEVIPFISSSNFIT